MYLWNHCNMLLSTFCTPQLFWNLGWKTNPKIFTESPPLCYVHIKHHALIHHWLFYHRWCNEKQLRSHFKRHSRSFLGMKYCSKCLRFSSLLKTIHFCSCIYRRSAFFCLTGFCTDLQIISNSGWEMSQSDGETTWAQNNGDL